MGHSSSHPFPDNLTTAPLVRLMTRHNLTVKYNVLIEELIKNYTFFLLLF